MLGSASFSEAEIGARLPDLLNKRRQVTDSIPGQSRRKPNEQ